MGLDFFARMTVTENNAALLSANLQYFYNMGIRKFHIGIDNMGEWTPREAAFKPANCPSR